jgi:AraC-like DNA-binding protein
MVTWKLDKDWLFEKYITESLSTRKIAEIVGCSSRTISLRLRQLGISTRTRGEKSGLNKNGREVPCSNECGKSVYRKLSRLKRYSTFFCSWKCEKEYQSKTRRISSFEEGWRRYKEYRKWCRDIRKRDNVCKKCGSSEKIACHHILEAKDYPSLVYDITNGIALCQSCHIEIHRQGSENFIKSLQEAILVE